MFALPTSSLTILSGLPLPKTLHQLPDNFILRIVVELSGQYAELVPDLNNPKGWANFKEKIWTRCSSLKITDTYTRLYENDEYPIGYLFQLSFLADFQRAFVKLAEERGFGDLVHQKVSEADPERLRVFMQDVVGRGIEEFIESFEEVDNWDEINRDEDHYWQSIHPTLPIQEQQRAEQDAQITASLLFVALHNAVAVMSCGQTLSTLVQRAIANQGSSEADRAMCWAVRIDNNLRKHHLFDERYLRAAREDDREFLSRYDNTTPPLAGRIRYSAVYFLFALLDYFGLLDRLSNPQILDLSEHANLGRWGNQIEDAGSLGKLRSQYLSHKAIRMSTHSK